MRVSSKSGLNPTTRNWTLSDQHLNQLCFIRGKKKNMRRSWPCGLASALTPRYSTPWPRPRRGTRQARLVRGAVVRAARATRRAHACGSRDFLLEGRTDVQACGHDPPSNWQSCGSRMLRGSVSEPAMENNKPLANALAPPFARPFPPRQSC